MSIKKEIAREVLKDIGRIIKLKIDNLLKLLCKALYPVCGNLSNNIQSKLEGLLGHEYYDAKKAFNVSLKINKFIYSLSAGAFMGYDISKIPIKEFVNNDLLKPEPARGFEIVIFAICTATVFLGIGLLEDCIRKQISKDNRENWNGVGVSASLVGKIISLPFDIATLCSDYYYHNILDYLWMVEYRIKNKEKKK
ncbi:MAG: hypothetical protein Q7U36_03755 [bacterium]|nr:hypothetical protein [bacterium]